MDFRDQETIRERRNAWSFYLCRKRSSLAGADEILSSKTLLGWDLERDCSVIEPLPVEINYHLLNVLYQGPRWACAGNRDAPKYAESSKDQDPHSQIASSHPHLHYY